MTYILTFPLREFGRHYIRQFTRIIKLVLKRKIIMQLYIYTWQCEKR